MYAPVIILYIQEIQNMTEALKNYINSTCERKKYVCYTDGSCNNLSQNKEGGAAYLILLDGKEIVRRSRALANTTNNRAEMLAIISAVNFCPIGADIEIRTDSQYAIISFLRRKKNASNTKNADLIRLYRKVATSKHISFEWVKGHNGDTYNEIVDSMANGEYQKMKELLKV